jgi:hypothetical protein
MSDALETDHRGYKIRYQENEDVWRVWALNFDGPTLSSVKAKIDRHLAKLAKLVEVIPAICVGYRGEFKDYTVISIAANKRRHSDKVQVWASKEREEVWRGTMRIVKDRAKVDADTLILDTPENRAKVREAEAWGNRIKADEKKLKEFVDAIPRLDLSALREEPEEDDAK